MSRSNLSIIGLYNFDSGIFEDFNVPDGMNKQDAIDTILLKNAELEILYPDTDFLKYAIGVWSRTQQTVWNKLYKTTVLDYNPIWNKDGKVTEVETVSNEKNGKGYQSELASGSSHRESGTESDLERKVAGFNESDLVDSESTHSEDSFSEDSTAENKASNVFANKDKEDQQRIHSRIEQGNIGVTTTQQMLREEREVALYNIYDAIAIDFKNKFCLQVY